MYLRLNAPRIGGGGRGGEAKASQGSERSNDWTCAQLSRLVKESFLVCNQAKGPMTDMSWVD